MVIGQGNSIVLNSTTVGKAIQEYINTRLQPGVNIKVLDVNQSVDNGDLFHVDIKDGGNNA